MSREYIASVLKRLRQNSGLTADQVGKMINKSGKTVNAWENSHGQPDAEILIQLCDIYNVDNILNEFRDIPKIKNPPLTAEEKMIIDSYRKFNTDGKKHLIEQITMMNKSGLYNEDKVIKIVARTGHTTSTVPENLDDFPDAPDTI